jgi:outer membrane immunogenic protein
MKKFTLTFTILSAVCALAYAGPEEYSGKEMKQVMPPPPPECPNWCGFYIGAFGGYKFVDTDFDLDLDGDWDDNPIFADERDALEHFGNNDVDADGGEVGGLLGFNFCLGHWLFGLEAAGGYLWARDSFVTDHFFVPLNGAEDHWSTSFKTHYLATVGPRFGYTFCRWMPYITGGVAFGDVDWEQQDTEHDQFFRQGGDESETLVGWFAGGGMEFALTNHWRLRGQYEYVDLGDSDFNSHGEPAGAEGFTGHHEVELREHNVSFAIIYGF